ncbi:MAG: hypothetical protein HYY85_05525 [Deltaproteobacteria bacterium]|nr:hypothetical protein [Deltaproteobacteria bacterium]
MGVREFCEVCLELIEFDDVAVFIRHVEDHIAREECSPELLRGISHRIRSRPESPKTP